MERKTTLTIRPDTSPLGRRITKRMADLDKNDQEFAEEIGIGYHTLRKVRRLNDPRPTKETLEKIADGLGKTAHWLLYGTEEHGNDVRGDEDEADQTAGKTIAGVMAHARKQIAEIAGLKLESVRLELKLES
jgi:transcriptional regulator with XRE-family HTH domain